jgi:hypothetical protein
MSRHKNTLDRLELRTDHRVAVESLCTEVAGEQEQLGIVVDLSENGLRLQRPLAGRLTSRIVQLEFELPEADELVWAKGFVCFDQLWRVAPRGTRAAGGRLVRTSGVRVVAAAARHLRMLRDYVLAKAEAPKGVDWRSLEPVPVAATPRHLYGRPVGAGAYAL